MPKTPSPQVRFQEFHAKHPEVYEQFAHSTNEMLEAGVPKVGAPAICERIRNETYINTDEVPYRLPNALRPHYAREFQRRNPELADRIRTHKLRKR